MPSAHPDQPLNDQELDRLDTLLESANPDGAMMLEEIDGFFAAIACGPAPIKPAEYLPEVLGLEDGSPPAASPHADELGALLHRHAQSIDTALHAGEGFAPILMHDEQGVPQGNLWAIGFLRGVALRPDGWESLDEEEQWADLFEPFETLAEEIDLTTGEVQHPITREHRQDLIEAMVDAAFELAEYFEADRQRAQRSGPQRLARDQPQRSSRRGRTGPTRH